MASKLSWDNYFKLPNRGLEAYFARVRSGSDVEYRTTFYKGRTLDQVLNKWNQILKTISKTWPTLYQYEVELGAKVGPMSIMKPLSERIEDIDSYYESILKDSIPIDDAAVSAAINWFSQGDKLAVRELANTVEFMKKSTNSGSPYFTKRRGVVADTIPCDVWDNYQNLPTGIWGSCAILGWRGQEGGRSFDDVKQRVVWMFPFAVNAQELRVYQPLIEMCQSHNLVPAWVSMEAVDDTITKLFDTKGQQDLVVCTDFSKFDQHFNPSMQQCASSILRSLLREGSEASQWMENVFPIKYQIPLAYDWGHVRYGSHGMGSGSGGTNADETLAHRALQYEAAIKAGQELNPNSMCLGDDGILSYPGIKVEDVVSCYSSHGQDMNLDKQYASTDDCTYLRRWHHKDYRVQGVCVGVYSTNRALGRLMEQERYYDPEDWGPKMVALRQLSILENVKYHPLREEFATFCMKGDKYRLGIDIPGFLDDIDSIASKATQLMPDFLGYTKSLQYEAGKRGASTGVSDWWIVKFLKSYSH
nr:MAG: RNA-dependent RNA polymerase [Porcine picobirnavirus]